MIILPKHERRIIMEQWPVVTRQILPENGKLLILQYFVMKKLYFGKPKYGVIIPRAKQWGEKALVLNFSTSPVQMFRLICPLDDCTVPLTALMDVLADWEGA